LERGGFCRGWEDGRGNQTNVQCKAIQNCHNKFSMHNEYIIIKMKTIHKYMSLSMAKRQIWARTQSCLEKNESICGRNLIVLFGLLLS
jgi:hypothetical protein